MKVIRTVAGVVGAIVLTAGLATAKGPAVSCKKIQDELKSGKTAADVAKDLKVSEARVKACSSSTTSKSSSTSSSATKK